MLSYLYVLTIEQPGSLVSASGMFMTTFFFILQLIFGVATLLTILFSQPPDSLSSDKSAAKKAKGHPANTGPVGHGHLAIDIAITISAVEVAVLVAIVAVLLVVHKELKNFVVLQSSETQGLTGLGPPAYSYGTSSSSTRAPIARYDQRTPIESKWSFLRQVSL